MKARVANSQGFTLMEMLIVVAIVTIMATLVVPSFGQILNRERLVSTTNNLAATYQASRSEAIKRSTVITVSNAGEHWLATDTSSGSVLIQSSLIESQLTASELPNLTISATGSVSVSEPNTMPVTITLANLNDQACSSITILSSGQVTTNIGSCS